MERLTIMLPKFPEGKCSPLNLSFNSEVPSSARSSARGSVCNSWGTSSKKEPPMRPFFFFEPKRNLMLSFSIFFRLILVEIQSQGRHCIALHVYRIRGYINNKLSQSRHCCPLSTASFSLSNVLPTSEFFFSPTPPTYISGLRWIIYSSRLPIRHRETRRQCGTQ
jgi:hypothetical protein